jgi:cell division protein FtsW
MRSPRIDRSLIILLGFLLVGGAFIFASAAFGLLARGAGHISSVVANHLLLGIGAGLVMLTLAANIDFRIWRRYAPYFFVLSLLVTMLVFVPQIGLEHGGGKRWIEVFGFSFQPSELLKLGMVVMAAAYFAGIKDKAHTMLQGLGGYLTLLAAPVVIMLMQPDLGTLGVISFGALSIYWVAGARLHHLMILVVLAVMALAILASVRPYVRDRVETFLNPAQGQQGESYQIRQSLIAIGSGGIFGRGFGQGIQKFTYLPEPMGDSVFAVASEELGFAGSVTLITLFTLFALRGFHIATRISDLFGKYIAVGISSYLIIGAFINIAAMLGIAPLTGIPLTFISQGGSAMMVSLLSVGVLLNVSRLRAHK